MGAVALATSLGTSASKATGRPYQNHLFWDSVNSLWWLLVYTSTSTLASYSSPDFSTWTARTTFTLTNAHSSEGRNLGVSFAAISSTAVLHIENSYWISSSNARSYHLRATISGTTISFGTESQVTSAWTTPDSSAKFSGCAVVIDSTGEITVSDTWLHGAPSDVDAIRSTNTDSGTSWTSGFPASATSLDANTSTTVTSNVALDLGSGNVWVIGDNAVSEGTWNQLLSSKWGGSSWSTGANVLASSLGTSQDANDWNAILVGSTIYIVYRTGSNTYGVRTGTNGTTFSTGTAPPNQTSKAGGGIALSTDGTSLWVGIIDSDAANTVRYVKWNGSSWDASWTALESTTQTRTALTCWPAVVSNSIGFAWTQTNGSNNDVYGSLLNVAGGRVFNAKRFAVAFPF